MREGGGRLRKGDIKYLLNMYLMNKWLNEYIVGQETQFCINAGLASFRDWLSNTKLGPLLSAKI